MDTVAEGKRIRIRGTVQGVGFRPWVYRVAVQAGVTGRVRNDSSGVTIDAFGDGASLRRFEDALHASPPPAARIADYEAVSIPPEPATSFVIVHSEAATERRVSIPPDLAICDDCVRDILDPANRRHRYPFTNCTNCGPRFTIATDVPYDRVATTMAPFEMCGPCRHEYEDVLDRRFHAQPTACPVCGPQLELVWTDLSLSLGNVRLRPGATHDPSSDDTVMPGASHASNGHHTPTAGAAGGADLEGPRAEPFVAPHFSVAPDRGPFVDAVAEAADAISRGLIVALKGLGGFHLACDATSEAAVLRLRTRKHRDEKPLAVMVRTLADAERVADLSPVHRDMLSSAERPIVLANRRAESGLAPSVAPHNRQIGVMLAYTPLHHLLLADSGVPLVMTSGNRSDEPIAFTNDDARARLGHIADVLLLHNREIHTRCDDSVAAVVNGAPLVIRRSRGYVPRAITLRTPVSTPVLAVGALLKNTFCLASGTQAFLGPHIGDLENLETYESFATAVERFQRFVDIQPEIVACDLHPDYMSTMWAEARPERLVRVQHHHAHVVSAMAEHGLEGSAIGIAYDGTGYGTDGSSWGGEILVARPDAYSRVATFRPLALIGGDRAVREPWRIALALLHDAYDGHPPSTTEALMPSVHGSEREQMALLLRGHVQVSLSHGVGRYFDAFGALFLDRRRAAYEGQVALEWNQIADPACRRAYPFDINDRLQPIELDLRPAVRAAVDDASRGVPAATMAAAFHNTVASATAAAVARVAAVTGPLPVVASGGVFQNALLAEAVRAALTGFDLRLHAGVPPGDGGIALGQAVIANAIAGGTSGVADL